MSMESLPESTDSDVVRVIYEIREAWYTGRNIVPIVGAGISADSGFPILNSIIRDLGALRTEINEGLYAPCLAEYESSKSYGLFSPVHLLAKKYKKIPSHFLHDFGWPDRNGLTQRLLTSGRNIDDDVRAGLKCALEKDWGTQSVRYKSLSDDLAAITYDLPSAMKSRIRQRLMQLDNRSVPWDIMGNWIGLIQHMTGFQREYADALFARLSAGRSPSAAHLYLAFLSKLMGLPLILSFNFDDLIEQAFMAEGIEHRVFAMEEGRELPHPTLVEGRLSIVKMHGSTHALLLDERINHPLPAEYKVRFDALAGSDPLLIVLGCSGGDRRLRDLTDYVLRGDGQSRTRIAWIHFENYCPPHLIENGIAKRGVLTARTSNPGWFLQHLYTRITGRFPASRQRYTAHIQRPVVPVWDDRGEKDNTLEHRVFSSVDISSATTPSQFPPMPAALALSNFVRDRCFAGFLPVWINLEHQYTLAGVVGSIIDQCRRYDTTIPPSVLRIDDQWQPTKNPDNISKSIPQQIHDTEKKELEKAIRRVADALQRGRYIVAFEGIETYPWPPSVHHGVVDACLDDTIDYQFKSLLSFIRGIIMYDKPGRLGNSLVCISIDPPQNRYSSGRSRIWSKLHQAVVDNEICATLKYDPPVAGPVGDVSWADATAEEPFSPLVRVSRDEGRGGTSLWTQLGHDREEQHCARLQLILLILSTFRRTRMLPNMRSVLEQFAWGQFSGRKRNPVDRMLDWLTSGQNGLTLRLVALEGGGYWFSRPTRDYIYGENSKFTSTAFLAPLITSGVKESGQMMNSAKLAAAQLIFLSIAHHWCARSYHVDCFVASADPHAFFEFTYHRIASIRYLTKLILIAKHYNSSFLDAANECCSLLAKAVDKADTKSQQTISWLDFTECDFSDSCKNFDAELQRRHYREVKSLYGNWMRAESSLRSAVPAEQLIAWCSWMATKDCDKFLPGKYQASLASLCGPIIDTEKIIDSEQTVTAVQNFQEYIHNLIVQLEFERSNYEGCLTHREESKSSSDSGAIHDQLDQIACKLALAFDKDETSRSAELLDISDGLKKIAIQWTTGSCPSDMQEARLRTSQLLAECYLPWVSIFTQGFSGLRESKMIKIQADGRIAETTANDGLRNLREQEPDSGHPPRNPLIGRTSDGSLYLPYRNLFQILRGRALWLGLGDNDFENAFRVFELARGGIGGDNLLLVALAELYTAEACLAMSRVQMDSAQTADSAACLGRSGAKLSAARAALKRSRELLLKVRRNVIWWQLFYRLDAQCRADQLLNQLVGLSQLQFDATSEILATKFASITTHIRRAYRVLRVCRDYTLGESRAPDAWFRRTWWEVTLGGFCFGRLAAFLQPPHVETHQADASSLLDLKWLNERAGHPLGRESCEAEITKARDIVKDKLSVPLPSTSNSHQSEIIKGYILLRQSVIDLASKEVG